MSGTSTWSKIRDTRVGEDPGRVERARQMMLAEARTYRYVSQAARAEPRAVSQPNISLSSSDNDVGLSTLKRRA